MLNDELQLAVTAISNNEIVGIPTETVYGIGVNPTSQTAVNKIFELKERDEDKPLSILISSFYDIHKLGVVSTIPEVVELYWPGPLTIIVETTLEFSDGVGTKSPNTIGIRVPDNDLAIELLKITGPLAVTSANISGNEDVKSDVDAQNIFGDAIKHYIKGEALHGSGSTIIDLREEGGRILREGPLKWPPSYC
ncbi:L-threonylcarbamoyladenylate synthase [Acidimicrobiaceae bacterium]|nr:L-threonylcarbamoyladenylate synthase [Acidimicrobiaceae bacterium]